MFLRYYRLLKRKIPAYPVCRRRDHVLKECCTRNPPRAQIDGRRAEVKWALARVSECLAEHIYCLNPRFAFPRARARAWATVAQLIPRQAQAQMMTELAAE